MFYFSDISFVFNSFDRRIWDAHLPCLCRCICIYVYSCGDNSPASTSGYWWWKQDCKWATSAVDVYLLVQLFYFSSECIQEPNHNISVRLHSSFLVRIRNVICKVRQDYSSPLLCKQGTGWLPVQYANISVPSCKVSVLQSAWLQTNPGWLYPGVVPSWNLKWCTLPVPLPHSSKWNLHADSAEQGEAALWLFRDV